MFWFGFTVEKKKQKTSFMITLTILHINEIISEQAIVLVEQYGLSHGLELADSLIASSAIAYRDILLTGNFKHYSYIPGMQITQFFP
jgi:predicted nucleic acid-binding protein